MFATRKAPFFGNQRAAIVNVSPEVEGGRYPIKRVMGDPVRVSSTIVADGHGVLSCRLMVRSPHQRQEFGMTPLINDRWEAEFVVDALGMWHYTVEAWVDGFLTWQRDFKKRREAARDSAIDWLVGAELVSEAGQRAIPSDASCLLSMAEIIADANQSTEKRSAAAFDDALVALMSRYADRHAATRYENELAVVVDRKEAEFSAWYEFFPRSCSSAEPVHGTLRSAENLLPVVADMGFDVVYLPPIHPIGETHRKGINNNATAQPTDVGSPWAIGNKWGGHTSIHPQLGTLDDFRHFVAAAKENRLEVAMDLAFQCSPDHPYVQEHPEWFRHRPDGSIQYAENPPKKYEDIYPFEFDTPAREALWKELKSVVDFWMAQGIRAFRVDNPHTKPLVFWHWLIGQVKEKYPDTIFLAEAFTRPALMYQLAKVGFTQSYTYFPWKNKKWEIEAYFKELAESGVQEFFRAHLWPNTPDILPAYLQSGGRQAFMIRLVLAATLGANYGIYGPAFDVCENRPRESGSEEYLNSEKYQIRHWDTESFGNIRGFIRHINFIRRSYPALQSDKNIRFHPTENENLICYTKESADRTSLVIMVVNVDPFHRHAGMVTLPLDDFGLNPAVPYRVNDALTHASFLWKGNRNYVELDPLAMPAHLFIVER